MSSSVEAIGAIGSASDQGQGSNDPSVMTSPAPTSPAPSDEPRWVQALNTPNAADTYSCFMLMLLSLNNLAMGNINGSALAQSNLMNTEQSIQQNLVTISSFLSELQQNSTADSKVFSTLGVQNYNEQDPQDLLNPNAFNGLASTFYQLSESGSNFGQEEVSSTYATSMQNFITAFKEIFYANTNANAPTIASLSEITNPNIFQNGQGFNLNQGSDGQPSFWQGLSQSYQAAGYNQDGYQVVSTNPTDTASLLQQYMFYRAQVTVDTGSISEVDGANGQMSQLVNFNAPSSDPASPGYGCDPFISQTLGLVSALNMTESVSREGLPASYVSCDSTTSGNLLNMMLTGDLNNDSTAYAGGQVGLYGAFSYMSFNDYWTKNISGNSNESVTAPSGGPSGWEPYSPVWHETSAFTWNEASSLGNPQGDNLAGLTTSVNGIQTNVGSVTSDDSVNMQSLSANESSYVNIGQNMIQNLNQSFAQWSQNELSA